MNFEIVKTYLLISLVLMSLILTFALWNYKPNLELLSNDQSVFINEANLGGKEELKRSLIEPSLITFHNNEHYYGFKSPLESRKLYHDMQDWTLKDFKVSVADGMPRNKHQVEVSFAHTLPLEMIRSLFTVDEKDDLPNWSFERMFILFNEKTSSLEIVFLSIDGHQQVTYVVNGSKIYDHVWSYLANDQEMSEYIQFGAEDSPIYLPADKPELKSRSLAVKNIDGVLLINDLFDNPTLVNTNARESYYTDGQRRMSILQEGRSMEFINPIHSNERHKDMIELLDLSVEDINAHKGWTNDFKLVDIDIKNDLVRYRMFYDGYPVYNKNNLSIIEQQWRNQDLHLYRRPLFMINTLLGGNNVTLPSGKAVHNYLINHDEYKVSDIKDIKVGYKLTYFDGASYDLRLDPTWYVNDNGNWNEINSDDIKKGGS